MTTSHISHETHPTSVVSASLMIDIICVALVLALVLLGVIEPRFHSDSWSLFELSETIFGDFYRVSTFRQFETTSVYSTAFPPLYPFLLALFQKFDGGIFAGIWLNTLICFGILIAMHRLIRTLGLPRWTGNYTFVVLLANSGFFDDFVAARTMPLAILLFILLIDSFVRALKPGSSYWPVLFAGMLSGASVMTRFDFLLPCFAVGVALLFLCEPERRIRMSLAYTLGLLPLLTPWVAYSLVVHGQFWASDNVRTVMSVFPIHVLNYEPDPSVVQTLKNEPWEWLYALFFVKAPPVAITFIHTMFRNLPLMIAVSVFFVAVFRKGIKDSISSIPLPLLALVVPIIIQVGTVVLTGYTVPRYFTASTIIIVLLVLTSGAANMIDKIAPRIVLVVIAGFVVYIPFTFGGKYLAQSIINYNICDDVNKSRKEFISTRQYEELIQALGGTTNPRILVMHNPSDLGRFHDPAPPPFLDPYRFGALTRIETFPQPLNYSDKIAESFVRKFQITHLYDPYGKAQSAFQHSRRVIPTENPWLFRLQ